MPEHHIFICFSDEKRDRSFLKALLFDLEGMNISASVDRAEIDAGAKRSELSQTLDHIDIDAPAKWTPRIVSAISACDAVVVILSDAAMNSALIMGEIGQGLSLNKPIITVLLKDANLQSPLPDFLTRQLIKEASHNSSLGVAAAIGSIVKRTSEQSELSNLLRQRVLARSAVIALAAALLLLITYLVLRSWKPSWFH